MVRLHIKFVFIFSSLSSVLYITDVSLASAQGIPMASIPNAPVVPTSSVVPSLNVPTAPVMPHNTTTTVYIDDDVQVSPIFMFFTFIRMNIGTFFKNIFSSETFLKVFDFIVAALLIFSVIQYNKLFFFVIVHFSFFYMYRYIKLGKDFNAVRIICTIITSLFALFTVFGFICYSNRMVNISSSVYNNPNTLNYYDCINWDPKVAHLILLSGFIEGLMLFTVLANFFGWAVFVNLILFAYQYGYIKEINKHLKERSKANPLKRQSRYRLAYFLHILAVYLTIACIIFNKGIVALALTSALSLIWVFTSTTIVYEMFDHLYGLPHETIGDIYVAVQVAFTSMYPIGVIGKFCLRFLGFKYYFLETDDLDFSIGVVFQSFLRFSGGILALFVIYWLIAALLKSFKKCGEQYRAFVEQHSATATKKKGKVVPV
ncbi:hypothetical protein PCE1_004735 [Barthelona sp. PCE]